MDHFLISKSLDPISGYTIEHRRSVFADLPDYWKAEDSWAASGVGETAEKAVDNLRRSTAWRRVA